MRSSARTFIVASCSVFTLLCGAAQIVHAQPAQGPGIIGSAYPTQLIPGQTTVLHMALVRNNPVQSIEIMPSAGITIGALTSRDLNQGAVWWEVPVTVAKNA